MTHRALALWRLAVAVIVTAMTAAVIAVELTLPRSTEANSEDRNAVPVHVDRQLRSAGPADADGEAAR